MLDARADHVASDERHLAFNFKPLWQRMAIVAAGPIVNFLFAIVALAMMFMIGVSVLKPKIGDVLPNTIAAQANLPVGGQITSINGHRTDDWEAVNYELIATIGHPSLRMTVLEDRRERTYDVALSNWRLDDAETFPITLFGLVPAQPKITNIIADVAPDSAAQRAGMQKGDTLLKIDGTLLENWEQTVAYIKARPNAEINVTILRNDVQYELPVTLGARQTPAGLQGMLGVAPTLDGAREDYVLTKQYGLFDAIGAGIDRTGRLISLSFAMLGKLFTGDVAIESLSGPVGIAQGAGASASVGFVYFLSFLALISVNLGIINLLPLPMLDGGHLLFFAIEGIRGKPLSEETQEKCLRVGAAIIFTIMAIAIVNDITRLT
jgi:regulator of sigma E protease